MCYNIINLLTFKFKKGVSFMRRRNKILTTALIIIPIICIIMIIIGILFNNVKLAVYVIFALILIAVISKICMTSISFFKSHINK